ncbi:glycosyltransferase family 31 protein [Pseudocercospora fijiensis CIRAD86]|uniref:N-acetylgalactosaminide beta-1,3-galactosyltransferase n=1 Tax=Pseudocercospora fijiensis (strain CIRAD86) TaxID=383855 RepID=N1Q743_PSEFD|nr:glycosyltransferase family 31 protein [Pseudocercospora fijiensis CIRAD86]EME88410.1 glycosyltransferase family 31 protein [Pseudocercospora fijiensis CIRAD86]
MLTNLHLPRRLSTRTLSTFLAACIVSSALIFTLLSILTSDGSDKINEARRSYQYGISHGIARTQRIGKSTANADDFCAKHPNLDTIAVVVKTGATAIHERLPTQLSTALRCVQDPLIFSDLEASLGDLHVHDVLSNFTSSVAESNADFDIYRMQREYLAQGKTNEIPRLRDLAMSTKDWRTQGKSAAWALDKYKFLHMVERSWQLQPGRKWYLFLEADTYLSWPTFLQWLKVLDSTQRVYIGSPVLMYEHDPRIYFAHGGAGIVLSGATVRAFSERQGLANRWDSRIEKMWFGDFVLADALHEELRLRVSNASLAMSPDDPSAISFQPKLLCQPIITIHHMTSQQLDQLWQFEREKADAVLTYEDMYLAMFPHGMPSKEKSNWDNGADSEVYSLPLPNNEPSADGCEKACQQNLECLSFVWTSTRSEKRCHLSRAFRYGRERTEGADSENSWQSGWMSDRIAKVVKEVKCAPDHEISWPSYELRPPS